MRDALRRSSRIDDDVFVGKVGEGVRWFIEEGMDEMSDAIEENPDLPVVLNLGVNDPLEIVGIRETQKSTCTGIEMFRKSMDYCEAGDNVGILLRGIKREQIERGQVLCAPGSVTPHAKFTGEIYVLTKEEGGRHTPFFSGYRPQFYFRTTDVTGDIQELTDANGGKVEMAMPGDHITITAELIHPIAMEQGLKFAIREGGHTVGDGRVSTILD